MSTKIFWQLMRKDLLVYRKIYLGKLLDILITFTLWIVVFGYFVPKMGVGEGYGVLIMVGAVASFGIWEIIGQSGGLITDITGDRTISYHLLLPTTSTTIFLQIAASWAIQSMLATAPLYFIGAFIFWGELDFSLITWHQMVLSFVTNNLFFGTFALWIAARLNGAKDLTRLYFRFINPLFLFGCYFFTWAAAYKLSPVIGYLTLLDPFTYVMEMTRSSILSLEGSLPFWPCFIVLWGFIALLGWHAVRSLRRTLDCV